MDFASRRNPLAMTGVTADADPAVESYGANEFFGQQDILANSRRAFSAVVLENATQVMRVPSEEYHKVLAGGQPGPGVVQSEAGPSTYISPPRSLPLLHTTCRALRAPTAAA